MAVDLAVAFHDDDLKAYNTIAEMPGTDLEDEVVMMGGHIDCWHGGTGATDNGGGSAALMEAVRILKALGLKPRRTIRVGLWSGEEQGLLGSRAYVASTSAVAASARAAVAAPRPRRRPSPPAQARVRRSRRYFNLDNGTGKIRGVYLQGNEAVRADLPRPGCGRSATWARTTLTLSNTGGTDHLSFDGVGLPGFQFIQDPVDYDTRTHHSNMDVYDQRHRRRPEAGRGRSWRRSSTTRP